MDFLQEAKDRYNGRPRQLELAQTAALIAQAEEMREIKILLAALVELGGAPIDFTDKLDEEGELPF